MHIVYFNPVTHVGVLIPLNKSENTFSGAIVISDFYNTDEVGASFGSIS